jgi:hypothetical protein
MADLDYENGKVSLSSEVVSPLHAVIIKYLFFSARP